MRALSLFLLGGALIAAFPAAATEDRISDARLYLRAEWRLHRAEVEAVCGHDDIGLAAVGGLRRRLGRLRSFVARGGELARLEAEEAGEEDIYIFARQAITFNISDARRLIRRLEIRSRNFGR